LGLTAIGGGRGGTSGTVNGATGCATGVGNIPAAYTIKRRIGSMKTNGAGQWTGFTQNGDISDWWAGVLDVNKSRPPTVQQIR
jgi:hypothetical protein